MEEILVTGSEGFIGKHLVNKLSPDNEVYIIDKKESIDVRWMNQLFEGSYDWIYHLAANADVRGGINDSIIDIENNTLGTHTVLEYMRLNDCDKLVFTSSAVVYGEQETYPTPEDTNKMYPISHYGASKLAAEHFITSYCHTYGMKAWIFRFGNIIGEGNTHGVISDFVRKLKDNSKILEILGNGEQTKQYLDVSDCIDGLTTIRGGTEKYPHIYNLAHHEYIKVKDLAKIVIDEMGLGAKIHYSGGDRGWKGDVPVTILDITKANKLGWKPKVSLEESIRKTVRYLIDN